MTSINKRLIVVLILIMLTFGIFSISISAEHFSKIDEENYITDDGEDYSSYIVRLKEKSVSEFKYELIGGFDRVSLHQKGNIISNRVLEHRNKLLSIQKWVKDAIIKLTGNKDIITNNFIEVFSGFVIKNIPKTLIGKIECLPHVAEVVPDYRIVTMLDDSVPLINADDAWQLIDPYDQNVTGKNVTIGIVDSGVDYNHPDLKDKYVGGYDFVNTDSDPMDDNGHGTHCAGIALGTGNASNCTYVGVAPDAKLYAYKVVDENGSGLWSYSISAMERAVGDGVDIISLSFGSDGPGHPDDALSIAANNAVKNGLVVVAAAGNRGSKMSISSPGCARKVICVGSSTKGDQMSRSSSQGPTLIYTVKPDIVAPGVNIVSTLGEGTNFYGDNSHFVGEYYYRASGTSMATPHVSGAAALIKQMHPEWSPDEIKMALRNHAKDIGESIDSQGYGRLEVFNSVNLSNAPPVAILNTSGTLDFGMVEIKGTATSDDFQNYTIYYEKNGDWVSIFTGEQQVDDDVLFNLDTKLIPNGTYMLKLEVCGNNQKSVDYVYITVKYRVPEGKLFTFTLTDQTGNPVKAWFLLTMQFHLPRLKYGDQVSFKAPIIFDPFKETMTAYLTFFKIFGGFKPVTIEITVVNT